MATLAPTTPPMTPPFHRRRKSWARKVERCCCSTLSYFPLTFVYGLTTWAVWVETQVSFFGGASLWAYVKAAMGVALYAMLNICYTTAVFTSPGSPLDERRDLSRRGKGAGYEGLPQYEDGGADGGHDEGAAHGMTMVTAKSSDGKARYCKKCACLKPDRTHHCSTCGRCVLKMDHHCPWLATCVGLRNYKPFLLFLIYTSLFCWLDLAVSGTWVWAAIMDERQMHEGMRVVNTILLAVLGGIIGLVLSGFTGWHIYLVVSGQTTIESLEKTRYLSPLRKSMERQFQRHPQRNYVGQDEEGGEHADGNQEQSLLEHLKETHANALPGVLRPEEGEGTRTPSPLPVPAPTTSFQPGHSAARDSLHRSYASLEAQREHERYAAFLDEQDSEKLPNAFDLGWRRNMQHVFGERPLYWPLPVCNTTGDGWMWEISPEWTEARNALESERRARAREEAVWEREGSEWGQRMRPPPPAPNLRWTPGQGFVNHAPPPPPGMGSSPTRRPNGHSHAGSQVQMQPLDRRKAPGGDDVDDYDTSSDEEPRQQQSRQWPARVQSSTANWNDIPDDFLASRQPGSRSRSRGRPKGD